MSDQLESWLLETFDAALERHDIQPWYQPVIRTLSGKMCSMEALARWVDPERGTIRPDRFIPVLEKHQLIHRLDAAIIREVCAQIRRTVNAGGMPVPVSVNLSRLDFMLCDIFSVVLDTVNYFQIPHDYLHIEITESVVAEREDAMRAVIDRFREEGFQVWMDDFGSGYSSLNVLKDFAFDELKLDMRFLSSFDQRSRRILASVIQMAKEIEIHTLAEGVETEEQFTYLRNVGCEKVQGFCFGKPQPFAETLRAMAERGVEAETPQERTYYDDIGRINLLSAVPFMTKEERDALTTARQLNSIALSICEIRQGGFRVLFCNTAFENTANATGMIAGVFSPEALGKLMPFSRIPARIVSLLDAAHTEGRGRMHFVSHDEYYELRAKRIAETADAYSVLLSLNNLSKASKSVRTDHLDEGMRRLYSLYERVNLLDVKNDAITPLYTTLRYDLVSSRSNIPERTREYARRWIFPDDRQDFIAFFDLSTLRARLVDNNGARMYVSRLFRSAVGHGEYAWKEYTLIRLDDDAETCLELIRNVASEVRAFEESSAELFHAPAEHGFPPELLWNNLIRSGTLRVFWKDMDRRFLGVSNAFLDYYGFPSEEVLLGRTDEEVGWHIRPDSYMHDEERVLHEGVVTHNIPGMCIANGENRDILASKMPVYDENGEIRGLLGYFIDKELLTVNDARGAETKRRDLLTGLLNSRGISEEAHAFQDEYYLRNTDFARYHVAINDFSALNRQYGFDFADKAMARLGTELKKAFGRTSAVGRYDGSHFAILRQVKSAEEAHELRNRIREIAAHIRRIDGVPVTLYLSVGYTLYSECENLDEQRQKTEVRLLANQDERASAESRQQRASEIFHVYDDLPISFAVCRVVTDESGKVIDTVVFYVNHKFEDGVGKKAAELLGCRTRELFPSLGEDWYEKVGRAALRGETVIGRLYYTPNGKTYYMTANQVIHPGYFSVTYQEMDLLERLGEK